MRKAARESSNKEDEEAEIASKNRAAKAAAKKTRAKAKGKAAEPEPEILPDMLDLDMEDELIRAESQAFDHDREEPKKSKKRSAEQKAEKEPLPTRRKLRFDDAEEGENDLQEDPCPHILKITVSIELACRKAKLPPPKPKPRRSPPRKRRTNYFLFTLRLPQHNSRRMACLPRISSPRRTIVLFDPRSLLPPSTRMRLDERRNPVSNWRTEL